MKVLLINGSPRENGNTFTALNEVAKTLNEEGVDTEIINIGKQAVQGCIACGMCGRNGARCTFRDDLYYKVWRAVKNGIDGLVIGSPVYYGGPNGSLCALLDRVFYSLGNELKYSEHARSQFTILEYGLWSNSRTGESGRGGNADYADAWSQHGLDDSQTQR